MSKFGTLPPHNFNKPRGLVATININNNNNMVPIHKHHSKVTYSLIFRYKCIEFFYVVFGFGVCKYVFAVVSYL